ncbi:MAG: hypothetical protein VX768_16800 [Planctomycetota bacterium]|nr:hypothetical protein [Planctomycetota bacterium]
MKKQQIISNALANDASGMKESMAVNPHEGLAKARDKDPLRLLETGLSVCF